MTVDSPTTSVGVIGGTGAQGMGLAFRLAQAGMPVMIGSRDAARARISASELGHGVLAGTNESCAAFGQIVITAIPWDAHAVMLGGLRRELAGKLVIDCVNPLAFDSRGPVALGVAEGSAAQQAQSLLPDSVVVGAFHNISAEVLLDRSLDRVDVDVLVLGDDRQATDEVERLIANIPGMRGIYAGGLRNCGPVEGLTANLIAINRRYKSHSSIRITDVRVDQNE